MALLPGYFRGYNMGDISPHFNRSEFACQCGCDFDTVDVETLRVLEQVRQHFMQPITITSGCRCEEHNKRIGGASGSQHTKGRAADFKVKATTPKEIYDFLDLLYPDAYGLGLYERVGGGRVHLDTRKIKARWEG